MWIFVVWVFLLLLEIKCTSISILRFCNRLFLAICIIMMVKMSKFSTNTTFSVHINCRQKYPKRSIKIQDMSFQITTHAKLNLMSFSWFYKFSKKSPPIPWMTFQERGIKLNQNLRDEVTSTPIKNQVYPARCLPRTWIGEDID